MSYSALNIEHLESILHRTGSRFSQFFGLLASMMHTHNKFQQNPTICGSLIDDCTNCPRRPSTLFGQFVRASSESWVNQSTANLERPILDLLPVCFGYLIRCFVSKLRGARGQILNFDTPSCKNQERVGNISKSIFRAIICAVILGEGWVKCSSLISRAT